MKVRRAAIAATAASSRSRASPAPRHHTNRLEEIALLVAPSHRIAATLDPASGSSRSNVLRGEAVVALRKIFAREGMRESFSAEQEGIFFTFEGRDEVSLQYNMPEHESFSPDAASFRKAKDHLLRCSSILAEQEFSVTLIISPRTLALFVRSDRELDATNSG